MLRRHHPVESAAENWERCGGRLVVALTIDHAKIVRVSPRNHFPAFCIVRTYPHTHGGCYAFERAELTGEEFGLELAGPCTHPAIATVALTRLLLIERSSIEGPVTNSQVLASQRPPLETPLGGAK